MHEWVDGDNAPMSYFWGMETIAVKKDQYCLLKKCNNCGQHWQVDESDRYHKGICIKIGSPNDWANFNDAPIRKDRLIATYGGLSDKNCIWSGCMNKALRDIAFCPECALEKNRINA